MPKSLFPSFQQLETVSKKKNIPLLFYFFKLNDEDKNGVSLRAKMEGHGASCLHWWNCEYALIGEGDYWTHSGVFKVSDIKSLLEASEAQVNSDAVINHQLYLAKLAMPPKTIMSIFKLLRPFGMLFDSNKPASVPAILESFGSEGGINPNIPQIEKHLANTRKTKAYMINLLQFKPKAIYHDLNIKLDISGAKAYTKKYGITAIRSVIMTGGGLVFSARIGEPIIESKAPKSTMGAWNSVAVMEYSNPSKLFSLKRMPGYVKALKHRTAGLLRTSLIISKK